MHLRMLSLPNAIASLDELCRALNSKPRGASHAGQASSDAADFPRWGVAPPDTSGLWSWDATRVLLSDRNGNFFIEPRDPEAWYPNEKSVSYA
jgi:hypothetical protein